MPTYRLATFGKLALSGGAAGTLSHQRRRLALLALLAAAGERGMSRDQLLAYLWSESSAENGRHSLEQLLHALRRSLGESVFSGVNPVRLDSDVVASDVNEFERALERNSFADAVALYGGPFLQGFYLNDAPEFERWTSTERARLADRYTEALNRLAVDAEKAGDHAAAVALRRRIADVDPVSSRSALALMRALVAAGDRTAALQHARVYEVLVQQELDSAPDPSIVKYAATLREEVDQGADVRESTVSKSAPLALDAPVRDAVPAEAAREVQAPRAPVSPIPRTSAHADFPETTVDAGIRGRRSYWLPAAIFVGTAALLFAALTRRDTAKMPALDSSKIVIVPFRTAGVDSSLKYLGEGIVDLIAPMLTGEGGPVAVDSRTAISTWNRITRERDGTAADAQQVARELGAGVVLSGAVVATGERLTLTGNLISGQTGETRPLTSVSAPTDSIDRLVDLFVGQLLTRQSGVAEASVSAVTSQSLPAIRAYLNGRAAYRRADEDQAIESFTRALDIDSTFALAALDLAVATGKMMRQRICRGETCRVYSTVPGFAVSGRLDDAFNRGVRVAWEQRSKLGRRDRPLLDALRGDSYPAASSSQATLANLRRAVAAAPDRPETHYLLGVILLYQGRALELPDARASADGAFREAVRLDPSYLAPLARMVDVAAFAGDTGTLRRASIRYLSQDSVGPIPDYVRWILAAGTGDIAGHTAIRSRLRSLDSRILEQIFVTSQMTGLALEDADTASSIIIENATDPIDKSVAFRRAGVLALNRGRPSAAATFLRNIQDLRSPSFQFENFSISDAIFNDGDRAVADSAAATVSRRLARDTLHIQPTEAVAQRRNTGMVLLALWHLYTGDTARARRPIEWLRRHTEGARNPAFFVLPEMLAASRARRANGAALRSLVDSATLEGCCFPEFVIPMLAQSYEASGDDAAALRVIRRGKWFWPPRNLSSLLRDEGRLATRLGDSAGAIRAYEHYLALRSDPEPVLRPERDRIRAELIRLKRGR